MKLQKAYIFNSEIIKNPDDLLKYLQEHNYPFDIQQYIDDKVLIEKNCSLQFS